MKKIILIFICFLFWTNSGIAQQNSTGSIYGQTNRTPVQTNVTSRLVLQNVVQSSYQYVGSYLVGDGPCWGSVPSTYNAQEAAALLFGGSASDYAISVNSSTTDQSTISHTAYLDRYGYGITTAAENFKVGITYVVGSYSAYVKDNSDGDTQQGACNYIIGSKYRNYVWRIIPVPTISCPSNITVNNTTGQCGANVTFVATSTSSPAPTITYSPASGSFFAKGTTTVTATATNAGGTATCTFTVTVNDSQAPTLTSPGNQSLNVISGTCAANYTIADPISDNCSGATWGYTLSGATTATATGIADGTGSGVRSFNKGVTTVTLSGTDGTNSATTVSFTVTVTDNIAPTLNSPGNQSLNVISGTCAANYTIADPISDNCSGATWGYTLSGATTSSAAGIADGTSSGVRSFNKGVTTVTLSGTDGTNSVTTTSFTVTVNDTEAPVIISCPANIDIVVNAGSCTASNVILETPITIINPDFEIMYKAGSTTVLSPPFNLNDVSYGISNLNLTGPTVTFSDGSTGSNFDMPGWTFNSIMGVLNWNNQYYPNHQRNMAAWMNGVNYGGPSSVQTMSQTLVENVQQNVLYKLTADFGWRYDNPTASPPILRLYAGNTLLNINSYEHPALERGKYVTWTQEYYVTDQSITGPLRIEFGMDANTNGKQLHTDHITLTKSIGLSDNCGIQSVSKTFNGNPVTATTEFAIGNHQVVWTVSDSSGNQSTCSQTVTVTDNQAPVISCQGNITNVVATSADGAIVNYTIPVGTDNCAGAITTRTAGLASGATFPIGTTTVTHLVTDAAGLTASCSFTVTVVGVSPSITCPVNINVNNTIGQCGAAVTFAATETVGIPASVITYSTASGSNFPVGTTTVTATATNAVGSSSCTFTVTVNDAEAPVISCPANISVNNDANQSGATVTFAATATDCSAVNLTYSPNSGSFFPIGSTQVTATATDSNNNSSNCTFTVTVVDARPFITCPANISVNNSTGQCGANVNFAATATGLGLSSLVSQSTSRDIVPYTGISCNSGVNTYYRVFDLATLGYSNGLLLDTINFGVEVSGANTTATVNAYTLSGDFVLANLTPIATQTVAVSTSANAFYSASMGGVIVPANSKLVIAYSVPYNYFYPGANPYGETGLSYLSADSCGVSQPVTYASIGFGANHLVLDFNATVPTTIVTDYTSGSNFSVGTTQVTATATNSYGSSSCTFDVTVNDAEAPVITCQADITGVVATSAAGAVVNYTTPVGTDNCTGAVTTRTAGLATGATFPIGTTTVTHLVTDAAGLTAECSFTVTVVGVSPSITCPVNINVNNTIGQCGAAVTFAATETVGIPASVITYSPASGSNFPVGTTTVTATATNAVGSSSCTFDVTVNDAEAPVITCAANISVASNIGCATAVTVGTATATDNCGVDNISGVRSDGLALTDLYPIGVTTITWTATDIHGNSNVCQQTVTVTGKQAVASPASQTKCSGSAITSIVTTGSVAGTSYDWTRDNTATVTGIAGSGSGSISGSLTNITSAPVTVTFTITPNLNGCSGTPVTATVTVDPTSVGGTVTGGTSICPGLTSSVLTLSGNVGTILYWESSVAPFLSWNPISNASATYTSGVLTETTQFRAVVLSGSCLLAESNPATVVVYLKYPFYADNDNDGYGAGPAVMLCSSAATIAPAGFSVNNTDCNDAVFAINPGVYDIPYDSIDNNCNGSLFDGHAPVVVSLTTNVCGSVNNGLNNTFNCNEIYLGDQYVIGYRFKVTNLATGQVAYVDTDQHHFKLTDTNIYSYGTSYSIQVAAIVNGEVQPYNGSTCTITSTSSKTTTKVIASQCGARLLYIYSTINATAVSSTNLYRFRVARVDAPTTYYYIDRTLPNFNLTMLTVPVGFLTYGTTYRVDVQIRVRLANIEAWSQFGDVCSVITPAAPETSLVSSQCQLVATSNTQVITANTVTGATLYRFLLTLYNNLGDLLYSQYYDSSTPSFTLSNFTGLLPNTTYSVAVAMSFYGTFTPYGKDCSITTPSSLTRMTAVPFVAVAYPNPFADNFVIDVKTSSSAMIDIKVYDMIGRLIEQRFVKVNELENAPMGNHYPTGVYNIVVTQGEEVKTLRVVKR